jgi:type III pantothenate kinase
MILAVNIGNTNIRVAVGCDSVISQTVFYTSDDLNSAFFCAEAEKGLGAGIWNQIAGSIVASVVPKNVETVVKTLEEKTGKPVKRINPQACGALNTAKYNGLLGDDRVVCCAMALEKFAPPFIVIDCGTATTVNVVNDQGEFLGGAILAGLQTGLYALTGNTAQLPYVECTGGQDISVIGSNTKECMLSGAVLGLAGAIEGFVRRLNVKNVIITGGHAPIILPHLNFAFAHEPSLLLDGLFYLYKESEF